MDVIAEATTRGRCIKRRHYWCTGRIPRSLGYSSGRLQAVCVSSKLAYAGMGKQILSGPGEQGGEKRRRAGDTATVDTCYARSTASCLLHKVRRQATRSLLLRLRPRGRRKSPGCSHQEDYHRHKLLVFPDPKPCGAAEKRSSQEDGEEWYC